MGYGDNQLRNTRCRNAKTRGLVLALGIPMLATLTGSSCVAGGWDDIPIPAEAGPDRHWRLLEAASDDFGYDFEPTPEPTIIGGKWKNYYFGAWEGPGTTKWRHENVAVKRGRLSIHAARVPGELKSFQSGASSDGTPEHLELPATRLGCISSVDTVTPPVYVEARARIPNAVLAANVWMLSADSTQEIDILESYGGRGDDNRSDWLAQRIHFSHHVFIRNPFEDYQPKDSSTWHTRPGLKAKAGRGYWTERYHRIGVYWRDPTHLEYYLDGELVKVTSGLDDLDGHGGIDPLGYTKDDLGERTGLSKPMHVIINMEAQSWNAAERRYPTDKEIQRREDHTFSVDWIRAYRPVERDPSQ